VGPTFQVVAWEMKKEKRQNAVMAEYLIIIYRKDVDLFYKQDTNLGFPELGKSISSKYFSDFASVFRRNTFPTLTVHPQLNVFHK